MKKSSWLNTLWRIFALKAKPEKTTPNRPRKQVSDLSNDILKASRPILKPSLTPKPSSLPTSQDDKERINAPTPLFGKALTLKKVEQLSERLNLNGPEKLWAVIQVETNGAGFQNNRNPKMLYERHWFSRLTDKKFDRIAPKEISASKPFQFNHQIPEERYISGQSNYDRLSRAIKYDRNAALKSASWGLGQVMGFNYAKSGYSSIENFVSDMFLSEDAQLTAMANFIDNQPRLIKALQDGQWAHFAKIYNGPNYKKHNYDVKLQNAYDSAKAGGLPDLKVRAAQLYLRYMGLKLTVDGELGVQTRAQIINYQKTHNLFQTGNIDNKLLAQLQKDIANLGKPDNWLF